jgi:hypothetical protein
MTSALGSQITSPMTTGCKAFGVYCLQTMGVLPEGFADDLARVVRPSDWASAAEIIESATLLDDSGLADFLRLVADRVRASAVPVKSEELREFLQRAATSV